MHDSPSTSSRMLSPGTLVLGKIKGYPWWPGMIVTDEQVTEEALKLKPATKSEIYAVYFFPDANYLWASKSEVKRLRAEEIDNFLKLGKGSKDLKDAYKMAAKPPTLQEITDLVKNGISSAAGNGESEDEENEEEEDVDMHESNDDVEVPPEDEEETEVKSKRKTPTSKKRKKSESVEDDEGEEPKKKPRKTPVKKLPSRTPSKRGSTGKPKTVPKSGQKDRRKAVNSDEEVDKVLPSPDKIEKDVLFVRHKLQKALLSVGSDIKPEEMPAVKSQLEKLSKFDGLTGPILKATKIGKVLKRIVNLVEIPRDEELKIREGAQHILEQWRKFADAGSPEKPEANGMNGKSPLPPTKIETLDEVKSNDEPKYDVKPSNLLETNYTETKEESSKSTNAGVSSQHDDNGKDKALEVSDSPLQELPSAVEKEVDLGPADH